MYPFFRRKPSADSDAHAPLIKGAFPRPIPLAPTHLGFICPERWFIYPFFGVYLSFFSYKNLTKSYKICYIVRFMD